MTNNTWTPGPWFKSATHYGKSYDIGAEDGDNVALVYGPEKNGSDNFRANARLIAAAPEMATLIERTIPGLWLLATSGNPDAVAMHDEARALLARIRGE